MRSDTEHLARTELIRKQASAGDPVCAEYLALVALNSRAGGGRDWIETQLDTEEDEDDFRPF